MPEVFVIPSAMMVWGFIVLTAVLGIFHVTMLKLRDRLRAEREAAEDAHACRLEQIEHALETTPVAQFLVGVRPTTFKPTKHMNAHPLDRDGLELYLVWCAGQALSQANYSAREIVGIPLRIPLATRRDLIRRYWDAVDDQGNETYVHHSATGHIYSTTFSHVPGSGEAVAAAVTVDISSVQEAKFPRLMQVISRMEEGDLYVGAG